jgi:chemotaxis-related protein WspD
VNPKGPPVTNDTPALAQATSVEAVTEVTGCWSNYGVYGDGSCLELQKFVHCRNCPVYSAAGVTLLDRPLPANYRKDWTRHFAKERRMPDAGNSSAILFRIQNDWLALPTHSFQEVAERRPIHSLPHRRLGAMLGLANVRGELVICVSLGHLLQMERVLSLAALRVNYRRLLVIQSESSRLAFPVDEVAGPHRFHPQEINQPPAAMVRASPHFVQGMLHWDARSAGLLDANQLFSSLDRTLA